MTSVQQIYHIERAHQSSFLNTRQTAEFQDVEDVIIEYNGGGLTVIEGAEAHYPVRLA